MDEPLAALDEITRSEMRGLLNQLVEGPGVTTLFVTHSIGEAVALSDRVLVSSPRPARIVADIEIDLPRPRPGDIDDDPRFFELCTQVRHALLEGAGE
jgi:NitT/TauT family transport system ATP-binding protein